MREIEVKERNFFEILKKLLWIVQFRKITYFKYLIKSLLVGINGVIHVLFLAKITEFLEGKDIIGFNEMLVVYGAYIVFFEVSFFAMKRWGWMETIPMGQQDILAYYLPKFITLDNNAVESIGTGKMMNYFDKGKLEWVEIVAEIFENGTMLFVSILFTIYMIGKVDFTYSFIFIILLILFLVIGNYSNNKLSVYRKQRYILRADVMKNLVKVLMSKIEILSNSKIGSELQKLSKTSEKLSEINKIMGFHRFFLRRVSQFTISVALLISFWYLGNQFLSGEISLSVLVGLTGTLIIMQKAIADVIGLYVKMTKRFISVERLWNFFDTTPTIQGYNEGTDFEYKTGNIEIRNMSFAYGESSKVFDNFSMNMLGGKITALVGNSGSGKTTLVKIISGYLRHDSGDVIIDNQKNKEISLKSLYKHIGYLTQDPSVFDGTIRENLMYGVSSPLLTSPQGRGIKQNNSFYPQGAPRSPGGKDAGRADRGQNNSPDLENIIKLSKCEFIYDFEHGLDTEIGEKGIRLSGGQKQRLAIAKIFLKNPEIIILDEPTSALDSFSEEQITQAMHNLFKDRTVIIIAHRLQTVKNADNIFVLENGKVVEEGTHETLIQQQGVYKKMLDLQSGF